MTATVTQLGARREHAAAPRLVIDLRKRRLHIDGRAVELSQTQWAFLVHLAADPTKVHTKEALLRDVWGYRAPIQTRTIDSTAYKMRQRIGGPFIENVWGVGYRLCSRADLVEVTRNTSPLPAAARFDEASAALNALSSQLVTLGMELKQLAREAHVEAAR